MVYLHHFLHTTSADKTYPINKAKPFPLPIFPLQNVQHRPSSSAAQDCRSGTRYTVRSFPVGVFFTVSTWPKKLFSFRLATLCCSLSWWDRMTIPRVQNGTSWEHHKYGTHNYTAPTLQRRKYRSRDIQKFNVYTRYVILKTLPYFFL